MEFQVTTYFNEDGEFNPNIASYKIITRGTLIDVGPMQFEVTDWDIESIENMLTGEKANHLEAIMVYSPYDEKHLPLEHFIEEAVEKEISNGNFDV